VDGTAPGGQELTDRPTALDLFTSEPVARARARTASRPLGGSDTAAARRGGFATWGAGGGGGAGTGGFLSCAPPSG
jgi:hypothetical protein